MIAFQKHCQNNQAKIMGFTIFMGIMTVMSVVMAIVVMVKDGSQGFVDDPMSAQALFIPVAFAMLLLVHKVFQLYIEGFFFNPEVLVVYRGLAKIAIIFALVIKPAFFMLVALLNNTDVTDLTIIYIARADFILAIVAYALNLVAGVTKLSRELEQEQELTI